ncbi:MAG: hypothetical protein CL927_00135 [Deltaproteobacteria bacterium]|nr:hypothetical protein [Deltaproteobacteria bacterium]HCH62533.1 hypothetical protein [Deltaproteobacteria bacterium]
MRLPHPSWITPFLLPTLWWVQAGHRAIGRRTGDLVSHIWAIWNGTLGDPTRSDRFCWPEGIDLLPIYGGWLHTFVGSAFARAGLEPTVAHSTVVCLWLAVAGIAGISIARACGARRWSASVGGVLLQLDGFVLYHAMDGRPEHAGLGFTALALAAALALWRSGGPIAIVRTGLIGAIVFVVSWEHALWLALACAWLLPWLRKTPTDGRAIRRWSAAAAVCLAVIGPWIVLFLQRALSVRAADEGQATLFFAIDQSIALIPWFTAPGRHPGRGLFLLALALPWLVPRAHRTIAIGGVIGLIGSWVLALGPSPGLWRGGDLWQLDTGQFVLFGPYVWIQKLPIFGWFHSPGRLVMGVSIAVAAGGALLVDRLWSRHRLLAVVLALALPSFAAREAFVAGDWPRPAFDLPPYDGVASLSQHPRRGAVLALPAARQGHQHEQRVVFQLLHQRPITGHIYLPYLAADQTPTLVDPSPFFTWASESQPTHDAAPAFTDADRRRLHEQDIAFVTAYWREMDSTRHRAVHDALVVALGPPVANQPGLWTAYAVEPP